MYIFWRSRTAAAAVLVALLSPLAAAPASAAAPITVAETLSGYSVDRSNRCDNFAGSFEDSVAVDPLPGTHTLEGGTAIDITVTFSPPLHVHPGADLGSSLAFQLQSVGGSVGGGSGQPGAQILLTGSNVQPSVPNAEGAIAEASGSISAAIRGSFLNDAMLVNPGALGTINSMRATWTVPAGLPADTVDVNFRVRRIGSCSPGAMPEPLLSVGGVPVWPDFGGDGSADRSVWRPAFGGWYVQGQATSFLGLNGDVPVPADYDGDGVTDKAVWRPSTGQWFIAGQPTTFFGLTGDVPVPADYDGDGDVDKAVWRPSTGQWFVTGQPAVYHGLSTDIPVPADYDGDGDADVAVFRKSVGGWYVKDQATVFFGLNGDIPVPGDFDTDGDADHAIWRPSVGGWYVQGQATQFVGLNGDVPVAADYDGNGTLDRAIWRPSQGGWYVQGQPTVFSGFSTDIPLPIPAATYRSFFP